MCVYATSLKHSGVILQLNTEMHHAIDGVGENPPHFLAKPSVQSSKITPKNHSVREEFQRQRTNPDYCDLQYVSLVGAINKIPLNKGRHVSLVGLTVVTISASCDIK